MTLLVVGLILFLGAHLFTTQRAARAGLIAKVGAGGYRGIYTGVALAGFVLIIYGFGVYRSSGMIQVWDPPKATKHIALLLMLPAFILLAVPKVSWLRAKTKHPMMLAIKLWATAHLLANGDLGGMVLFGAFLAWAVFARIAVKRRERVEGKIDLSGVAFGGKDMLAIGIGIGVYVAFVLWLHPLLIGVAVIG